VLPEARVGTFYAAALVARGQPQPYRWRLIGGKLPPGIVLDPGTGRLHGTPTAAGESSVVVELTGQRRVRREEDGSQPFIRSRARRLTMAVAHPVGSVSAPEDSTSGSHSP
jgi:hypothetical protein